MAPDDVQRRLLLGRYATREEADAVLAETQAGLPDARVIPRRA